MPSRRHRRALDYADSRHEIDSTRIVGWQERDGAGEEVDCGLRVAAIERASACRAEAFRGAYADCPLGLRQLAELGTASVGLLEVIPEDLFVLRGVGSGLPL
jgi:hypothetical protein